MYENIHSFIGKTTRHRLYANMMPIIIIFLPVDFYNTTRARGTVTAGFRSIDRMRAADHAIDVVTLAYKMSGARADNIYGICRVLAS